MDGNGVVSPPSHVSERSYTRGNESKDKYSNTSCHRMSTSYLKLTQLTGKYTLLEDDDELWESTHSLRMMMNYV
jgi:hypothetical protein